MMWNGPFGFADGWSWLWPFHFVIPLLFLALIITAVVLIVRYAIGEGGRLSSPERRSPGIDALEERYARGEINRDEYLVKKRDITA